jgi:hypothetical protein
MTPEAVRLESGQEIPWSDVVRIRFERQQPERTGDLFLLSNGDLLVGRIDRSDGETLLLEGETFGTFACPLKQLLGIVRRPSEWDEGELLETIRETAPGTAQKEQDLLILQNGDRVSLLVQAIEPEQLRAALGGVPRSFPMSEVRALQLIPLGTPPAPQGTWVEIEGAGPERISGSPRALQEGRLLLHHPTGTELSIPLERITAIRIRDARYRYCSDLDPLQALEHPYGWDPSSGEAPPLVWRFRRDREAITGGPLKLRGRRYRKGLGAHSYSRITYPLHKQYLRFLAEIGVDDSALDHGNDRVGYGTVIFRVEVDEKERFRSEPLDARSGIQSVAVDCRGADAISLVVEFAARADILDRAVWGDALLVR